jgi:LysM repeat protein
MAIRRGLIIVLVMILVLGGASAVSAQEKTHTVQPGETLGTIAQLYGVTITQLAAANGIANPNLIFAGQVLKIPGTVTAGTTYTVQSGDTLFGIAIRFGTTVDALVQLNGLTDPNVLKVGQVLKITAGGASQPTATKAPATGPAPTATIPPPPVQTITYTVKAGDTLGAIAINFDTTVQAISLLNNLPNPNLIYVGQVLTIKKGTPATNPPPTATTVVVTLPVTPSATKTNTPPPLPTNTATTAAGPSATPAGPTVTPIPTSTIAPTDTPTPEPTFPPGFATPTPLVAGTSLPNDAVNRLENPGFEGPFREVVFPNAVVEEGWEPFYCDQPYTAEKCPALRQGTGNPQGLLMGRPLYSQAAGFGIRTGAGAQKWSCPWTACRAGVYQIVDTIPGATCTVGAFVMSFSANNPTALFSDLFTFDDRANSTWFIKVDPNGSPDGFTEGLLESPGFGYAEGIYDAYTEISFDFTATSATTSVFFENLRLWPLTINDNYLDDAYVRCNQ